MESSITVVRKTCMPLHTNESTILYGSGEIVRNCGESGRKGKGAQCGEKRGFNGAQAIIKVVQAESQNQEIR